MLILKFNNTIGEQYSPPGQLLLPLLLSRKCAEVHCDMYLIDEDSHAEML